MNKFKCTECDWKGLEEETIDTFEEHWDGEEETVTGYSYACPKCGANTTY